MKNYIIIAILLLVSASFASVLTEGTAQVAGIFDQVQNTYTGVKFQANQNLTLMHVRFLTSDQATTAYLLDQYKVPIGSGVPIINHMATFTADNNLTAGDYYYVAGGGGAYNGYYVVDALHMPNNFTNVNMLSGLENGVDLALTYYFSVASVTTRIVGPCDQNLTQADMPFTTSSTDNIICLQENVTTTGTNGITINNDRTTVECGGHSITGNDDTGTYGVYFAGVTDSISKNCVVKEYEANVYFNTGTRNTLTNTSLSTTATPTGAIWGNIYSTGSTYNLINNITITSPGMAGIRLVSGSNYNTIENVSINISTRVYDGGNGIGLSSSSYNSIRDVSIFTKVPNYDGIKFLSSNFNNVSNTFINATFGGTPYLESSNYNIFQNITGVTDPLVSSNAQWLRNSNNNLFMNNHIRSYGASSLVLNFGSDNNQFFNNSLIADVSAIDNSTATGTNNTFLGNNMTAPHWTSITGVFNDSSTGNIYYGNTGTPSWLMFPTYTSSNTANYSNLAGSYIPYNKTTTSGYFNAGEDWHPWTENFVKAPTMKIQLPANTGYYTNSTLSLFYSAKIGTNPLSSCWYNLDGGTNVTLGGCANGSIVGVADGQHSIAVAVNDNTGMIGNMTSNFTIDSTAPILNLISPTATTYLVSNISLKYTVSDAHLSTCWYSLDGTANITLTSCQNISFTTFDGNHILYLYANDSGNLQANASVYFMVNTAPPPPSEMITCNFVNATLKEGTADTGGLYDQSDTGYTGIKIQANMELYLNKVQFLTSDGSTFAHLLDWNKVPIGSAVPIVGGVANFSNNNLTAGDYYYIVGDNNGAAYDGYYVSDLPNMPKNFTYINVLSQLENGVDRNYHYYFSVSSVTTTPIVFNTSAYAIKYTILDSATYAPVNATFVASVGQIGFTSMFSFPANSAQNICITPSTGSVLASINESFSATGYNGNFISRPQATYSSALTSYMIYMINSSSTTNFQTIIQVIDNNRAPLSGYFVQISRQNVTSNSYYPISYTQTDINGQSTVLLTPNSVLYKFSIYDSTGKAVQSYSPAVITCNTLTQTVCNVVLVVGQITSIPYVSTFNYANASCTWNNATGDLSCTPLGSVINSTELDVILVSQTAYNSTICNQAGVGTATVTCSLPTDAGNCYQFAFRGTLNTGGTPDLAGGQVCIAGPPTFTPNNGVGLLLAFILLAIGAILGLAFGVAGTLIGMAFGLMIAIAFSFITGIFWYAGIGGVAVLLLLAWVVK
jgi:hypothetical protein